MTRCRRSSNWASASCRRSASRTMSLRVRPLRLAARSSCFSRSGSSRIVTAEVFMYDNVLQRAPPKQAIAAAAESIRLARFACGEHIGRAAEWRDVRPPDHTSGSEHIYSRPRHPPERSHSEFNSETFSRTRDELRQPLTGVLGDHTPTSPHGRRCDPGGSIPLSRSELHSRDGIPCKPGEPTVA